MVFATLRREVTRKLRQVGFSGTLKRILSGLLRELHKLCPSYRRFRDQDCVFDRKYGTETSGRVRVGSMDISRDKLEHTVKYQASRVELFERILRELPIRHEDYTLIDLGSGKGRTLLLASNFPFRKIIGIELSHRLSEIARRNIRIYKSSSQKCSDLEVVCIDAKDFEIPDEKTVFYLYNPFDEYVMREVLSNIEASLKRYASEIYLVYVNPVHYELMDQAPFLRVIKKGRDYLIYVSKNDS